MEDEIQHQIPQQISSYQFRLVGDMTLQQFFQVAGGAIIALMVYSSGLPGYIKWPIVLISFLTGVAFAFFPLEDRPLQKWVMLYFKAIYSPTLFIWKQDSNNAQGFFQKEDSVLSDQQSPSLQPTSTTPVPTPVPATSDPAAASLPELEKKEQQILSRVTSGDVGKTGTMRIEPQQVKQEKVPEPIKDVEIPKVGQIEVEKRELEEKLEPVKPREETTKPDITPIASQPSTGQAKQAQFNQDAGPPIPPSNPNVIVGQVLGPNGEIVENAILEIKDMDGRPVRALKSNRLGHFMIVTSLSNGKYEIITEKDGLDFDKITFEAKGEVIPPIAIWANKNGSKEKTMENQTENLSNNDQQTGEQTIYNQGDQS